MAIREVQSAHGALARGFPAEERQSRERRESKGDGLIFNLSLYPVQKTHWRFRKISSEASGPSRAKLRKPNDFTECSGVVVKSR